MLSEPRVALRTRIDNMLASAPDMEIIEAVNFHQRLPALTASTFIKYARYYDEDYDLPVRDSVGFHHWNDKKGN